MKAYTDLSQSKKLTEILPLESADMVYIASATDDDGETLYTAEYKSEIIIHESDDYINCWSLAALLDILHEYTLQTNSDGSVFVVCDSYKPMISDSYSNPVDACYEIILGPMVGTWDNRTYTK